MNANPALTPFTLEGRDVRLDPLRAEHARTLWNLAKDHLADLFQWIPYKLESLEDFTALNRYILDEQKRGVSLPFVTVKRQSNQIVGTTRFMNMDLPNRKVEIGST